MQPAERQNLFADNLLLGPLYSYRASPVILRPLCNAPRPRNRRVHAQAQAVKVSSVPEKFAAVEGHKKSPSWRVLSLFHQVSVNKHSIVSFQELTKILRVTVCHKLRGYLLENTSLTHNKFNKEEDSTGWPD